MSFVAQRTKRPAHGRTSRSLLLFVNCLKGNITHSSLTCRYKPFCRQQGVAELDLHGYIRKRIPVQIIRQSSHNGLLPTGLPLCCLRCRFLFENTFVCCKDLRPASSLVRIWAFSKTSVNVFGKKRGHSEVCRYFFVKRNTERFRSTQKHQLRFTFKKRPMRRVLSFFK